MRVDVIPDFISWMEISPLPCASVRPMFGYWRYEWMANLVVSMCDVAVESGGGKVYFLPRLSPGVELCRSEEG